ncbi:MAG: FtsB family cell division protein [Rhizobiaceae bacterium]
MWTRQKKRTYRSKFVLPTLTIMCLSYFGFHALHGHYGIYSAEQLELRKAMLTAQLAERTGQRQALERQVALLQDNHVERDMLEEQARRMLNYSNPADITILDPFEAKNQVN